MTHFCSKCEYSSAKSTKYHSCPECSSKLQYICPNCKKNIYSSNSKHRKNCKVQVGTFTPTTDETNYSTNFLFGKSKIICEFQNFKICIAYYNMSLKRILYGKERPKCKSGVTHKKKKEQVKFLKKKSNINSDEVLIEFSSLYSK